MKDQAIRTFWGHILRAVVLLTASHGHAFALQPLLGVKQVALGDGFSCAVVNGSAQCWGSNYLGALGNTAYPNGSPSPIGIAGLGAGVTAIAAQDFQACAIVGGGAQCWGTGDYGTTSATPVPVPDLSSGVLSIAVGSSHACALVSGGNVKCWGSNGFGQLGDNRVSGNKSATPVTVVDSGNIPLSAIVALAAGRDFTCAQTMAGTVDCWGYTNDGVLGNPLNGGLSAAPVVDGSSTPISGVASIAANDFHTCAVTSAGGIECWGNNTYGDLGNPSAGFTSSIPVAVVDGSNVPISGATAIAAGLSHSCAIVGSGAKCWGYNSYGQLGNTSKVASAFAVDVSFFGASEVKTIAAGSYGSCATVVSSGITLLECWGYNGNGQLALGGIGINPKPVGVNGLSSGVNYLGRGASAFVSCASVNGAAKCWGEGDYGQLGNGATVDASIPQSVTGLDTGVSAIAAATIHSCAIVAGAIKCWGQNNKGQLGIASPPYYSNTPVQSGIMSGASAIAVGGANGGGVGDPFGHSCAIVNGDAYCWGFNSQGQLGNSSVPIGNNSATPVAVMGLSSTVTDITAGAVHTCAVFNGAAYCWGSNYFGTLGNSSIPTGNNAGNFSATPVLVAGFSSGATKIAAGDSHTCAIVDDGAKCWGNNYSGQLGNGSSGGISVTPVPVMGLISGVTAITAGGSHSCAIVGGGALCWGSNNAGQLGDGTTKDSNTPIPVAGLGSGVSAIAAGEKHTCATLTNGAEVCWGDDSHGELGYGHIITAESPLIVRLSDSIFRSGFEAN